MKKTILIFLAIVVVVLVNAQNTSKQKELGLSFRSINSFGINFKTGSEKSLWRFSTLYGQGMKEKSISDSLESIQSSNSASLKIGKEYRKSISDHLEMRLGADLSFGISSRNSEEDDLSIDNYDYARSRITFEPGLNFVFGFNYLINETLLIGAEILPGFNYVMGKDKHDPSYEEDIIENKIRGFRYGLSNTSAQLILACRF